MSEGISSEWNGHPERACVAHTVLQMPAITHGIVDSERSRVTESLPSTTSNTFDLDWSDPEPDLKPEPELRITMDFQPCSHPSNMEFFRSLLRAVGLLEPSKVDFIAELPLEVSQLILRKLDPESLLCAAQVSRKWMRICRSDKLLRDTAKDYKRNIRRKMMGKVFGLDLVVEEEMEVVRRRHVPRNTLPPKTVVFAKTREPRGLPKRSKVSRSSNAKPVKSITHGIVDSERSRVTESLPSTTSNTFDLDWSDPEPDLKPEPELRITMDFQPCSHPSNMEFFRSLLRAVGLLEPSKVDFIAELPLEVSQLILRKLDPESLLCAAQVSRKWMRICRSDKLLRDTARDHKRNVRRKMMGKVFGLDLVAEEEMEVVRRRHVPRNTLPPKTVVFTKTREPRGLPKRAKVSDKNGFEIIAKVF
ncbi:hypothetical protein WN51_04383 [Melipona quadrifasciata]|uniref:F-box domain-containing protein n=1 Tax=Melipona quadrifasciata TaxID=166423 RepID=A0A0M8ZUL4_9HYME|nr:hypothetical protein WN51_04383 [Melipona quadrifasciata]